MRYQRVDGCHQPTLAHSTYQKFGAYVALPVGRVAAAPDAIAATLLQTAIGREDGTQHLQARAQSSNEDDT